MSEDTEVRNQVKAGINASGAQLPLAFPGNHFLYCQTGNEVLDLGLDILVQVLAGVRIRGDRIGGGRLRRRLGPEEVGFGGGSLRGRLAPEKVGSGGGWLGVGSEEVGSGGGRLRRGLAPEEVGSGGGWVRRRLASEEVGSGGGWLRYLHEYIKSQVQDFIARRAMKSWTWDLIYSCRYL